MAHLIDMNDRRPEPLKHEDGEPVAELPGLVWYQDCPVLEDAWRELEKPQTNGWLEGAA